MSARSLLEITLRWNKRSSLIRHLATAFWPSPQDATASSHEIMTFVHLWHRWKYIWADTYLISQEIASHDPALPKRNWAGEISDSMTKAYWFARGPISQSIPPFCVFEQNCPLARSSWHQFDFVELVLRPRYKKSGWLFLFLGLLPDNFWMFSRFFSPSIFWIFKSNDCRKSAACELDCATSSASQHSWHQDCRRRYTIQIRRK